MDTVRCPRCSHQFPVPRRVPARRGFECSQCGAVWSAVPEASSEPIVEVHVVAHELPEELLQRGLQAQRSTRSRAGRPALRVDFELGSLTVPADFLALLEHFGRSRSVLAVEVDGQPLHPTDASAIARCRAACPAGDEDSYCRASAPGLPNRFFGCRRLTGYQRGDPHEKGWWRFQIPVGTEVQIDKAALLSTLRREVRRMGVFACPLYKEERLREDVAALPDTLAPDGQRWFGQVGFRGRRRGVSGIRYRAPDGHGALAERMAAVLAGHGLTVPAEAKSALVEELLALFAPPEASHLERYAGLHELLRSLKEAVGWPELERFRFEQDGRLWVDTSRGPVPFFEEEDDREPDDDPVKERFKRLEL